jgi:hypothetical protein
MKRWKFCKYDGYWYLCISELEQLFEYHDRTNSKYGVALVKGDNDNKYLQYAKQIAESNDLSLLDGMVEVQSKIFQAKLQHVMKGKEIWINEVGGFNFGYTPEKTVYVDKIVFPHYSEKDIKISQWGGDAKGSHYYVKIGDIEVKDGDVMKWDTRQEAYDEALKYISV